MSKKSLANTITMSNTTDIIVNKNINISTGVFTINNTFSANSTSNKMYLPSSSTIFIGNTTTTLSSVTSSGVPSGLIIMWVASATPPSGWAVCNGVNNTPNLVGRFILCNSTTYTRGTTGGSSTVTLQNINIPAHTHWVSQSDNEGAHTHTVTYYNNSGTFTNGTPIGDRSGNTRYPSGNSESVSPSVGTYANHQHDYTTPMGGGSATATPISILPRHYSVIYIIKQ